MMIRSGVLVILTATILVSGCATNRSEVALMMDKATPSVATQKNGRQVAVSVVVDERVFVDGSADPSLPSLGFEGSAVASSEMKARAIARKRNGYGKALGDVVLQEGQSVSKVIREATELGLTDAGFTVLPGADGKTDVAVVEVHVKQFWSWMTPGFWALTFENKFETLVSAKGKSTVTLSAKTEDSGQIGTDSAYVGIAMKGLSAYRAKVAEWAKSSGI